jgi:hypothetical protein
MGTNISTLNQMQNNGCYLLQSNLWPTYDASLSWDAVLGCGCRTPSGLADDWLLLNPSLNMVDLNDESFRLAISNFDLAIDRSTMGHNFQCHFCHGRCGRPWALWTRRSWGLEERLEDIDDWLYDAEHDARRGYRRYGPGRGLGYVGMPRHHIRYGPHDGLWRSGGHGLMPASYMLRQPGGVNLDLINLGRIDIINAPGCQRNRRVSRNRTLMQNHRHGY